MSPMPPVSRRILVVDDEPLVRDAIRRVLQFDGHTVDVAANGEEALSRFQNSRFHLVITDYDMPGMNGDALAVAIKAIHPLQPILMVSAHGEQLRSESHNLAVIDTILTKPFQIGELREAIASLLAKSDSIMSARVLPDATQSRLRP